MVIKLKVLLVGQLKALPFNKTGLLTCNAGAISFTSQPSF